MLGMQPCTGQRSGSASCVRARPHAACSARQKRSKPYSESKGSETGRVHVPHETHDTTVFAAEILLATGIVPGRWTQRAYGEHGVPMQRQKRSRPYVGSNNSAPGCACGPHETNGTTTLAAETSLAAGTVPDCRTQRAYGSAACRAPEALLGAPALQISGDPLDLPTPRDARRHIPRN